MSDIISILEGMGLTLIVKGEAYKFLVTVFGKSAEELSGLVSNEVKCFNARRTTKALVKVFETLKQAQIDPKEVQMKSLIPLLEGVSIEDDETLQDKWINLLTTTIAEGHVHPSFPKILSELSLIDAMILDALFQNLKWEEDLRQSNIEKGTISLRAGLPGMCRKMFQDSLKLTSNATQISLDNLIRLNMCTEKDLTIPNQLDPDPDLMIRFKLSVLGKAFMEAIGQH